MLYQPPPLEAYSPLHISIDGTNLNAVEHFTYLGSVISSDAIVSKDLDNCLFKVSSSLEDCQREYGRATRSTSPQRSKFTGPSLFPPPCTVQRPGYSIGNRSGYWSVSPTLLALHPWHQMARLRVKRRSPKESQPAQHKSPSCFRFSCTGLAMS